MRNARSYGSSSFQQHSEDTDQYHVSREDLEESLIAERRRTLSLELSINKLRAENQRFDDELKKQSQIITKLVQAANGRLTDPTATRSTDVSALKSNLIQKLKRYARELQVELEEKDQVIEVMKRQSKVTKSAALMTQNQELIIQTQVLQAKIAHLEDEMDANRELIDFQEERYIKVAARLKQELERRKWEDLSNPPPRHHSMATRPATSSFQVVHSQPVGRVGLGGVSNTRFDSSAQPRNATTATKEIGVSCLSTDLDDDPASTDSSSVDITSKSSEASASATRVHIEKWKRIEGSASISTLVGSTDEKDKTTLNLN